MYDIMYNFNKLKSDKTDIQLNYVKLLIYVYNVICII